MQTNQAVLSSSLTTSCFDLDAWEYTSSGHSQFPSTLLVDEREDAAEEQLPFIPTVCLSLEPASARLENWRLAGARNDNLQITPNHIIGAIVRIARGRTSPIASIDPATRRIRTASGSVYELGAPEKGFHKSAPLVLRCLGF